MSKLPRTIFDLNLSTRSRNCLATIATDLRTLCTKHSWEEVRWIRQFGRTSQRELLRKLDGYGLSIGMSEAEYDAAAGIKPSLGEPTLRDYFAAKAMAARAGAHYGKWHNLAHEAYVIADAMLAAREAKS